MYTTLKEVLNEAEDLNMAIGAFNTHNLEMLPSIIKAAVNQRTPVIIQTSCGTANYIGHKNLVSVCKSMAEQYGIDVVLHLDHAINYETIFIHRLKLFSCTWYNYYKYLNSLFMEVLS